jgi:hypothetical protein
MMILEAEESHAHCLVVLLLVLELPVGEETVLDLEEEGRIDSAAEESHSWLVIVSEACQQC